MYADNKTNQDESIRVIALDEINLMALLGSLFETKLSGREDTYELYSD
jgi:hypothetical protein